MAGANWSRRAAIAGLTAGIAVLAGPGAAQSVSGTYRAEGRNPDGSAYHGAVSIRETGGNVYVSWSVAGRSYEGTGVRNGDVVWVDWGDRYPVIYVRMPSGELHGTWANGRALERLIP